MERIIVSLVTAGLMLSLVETVSAFSGTGSGIPEDPYIITDVNQLQEMKDYLKDPNVYFQLGNDIDASATSDWHDTDGDGFTPIGDNSNRFKGHFDGNDFTISGLYINRSSTSEVGLFGCTSTGSEIKNVGLEDVSIAGGTNTGGLSGYTHNGTISGCYTTGSITGSGIKTGGLVGYNEGSIGSIIDSYFTGNVNGNGDYVGGLVGRNCAAVSNAYSTGSVGGNGNYIGGLVGENTGAISNSCSTASASGGEYIGGLVGWNNNDSTINDSYSTGSVSGGDYLGGLISWNWGDCNDCFWDTETSKQDESTCGTGKTTAEMMQQVTFTNWDFKDVWDIHETLSYPFLRSVVRCGDQWHPYPVGDLNYDCHVDLLDFATFATHWLECTAPECN